MALGQRLSHRGPIHTELSWKAVGGDIDTTMDTTLRIASKLLIQYNSSTARFESPNLSLEGEWECGCTI